MTTTFTDADKKTFNSYIENYSGTLTPMPDQRFEPPVVFYIDKSKGQYPNNVFAKACIKDDSLADFKIRAKQ